MVGLGTTGVKIHKDDWNGHTVKPTDPLSSFKNEKIQLIRGKINAIYNDLYRSGKPFTVQTIKKKYLQSGESITFLSAFQLWLKQEKGNDPYITSSTLETYDKVRKKVVDFLIEEKELNLPLELFDVELLKKYRRWMKKKHRHEDSYIRKHSQVIKQVTKWAPGAKLADFDPLQGFRVPNEKSKAPVFLTPEQFEQLKAHQFSNVHLQEVADVFIIYCRTGFHYADLKAMAAHASVKIKQGVDATDWIYHNRIKTDVMAKLPVFKEVLPIIEKYGGWENLPIKANQTMNDWLKLMAAELKFPEPLASKISTKTGRKTFTDWCLNSLGMTEDAVKVMLGRLTTRGLEVYGRPDERRVALELGRLRQKQYEKID